MQACLEDVHVDPVLHQYAVELVAATRADGQLEVGASPRGSLALLKLGRARAVLSGRDFVSPDDIRSIAVPALAHRVVLRAEAWARQVSADEVVRRIVDTVAAPSWT
jgi:MoxR-like ATPase